LNWKEALSTFIGVLLGLWLYNALKAKGFFSSNPGKVEPGNPNRVRSEMTTKVKRASEFTITEKDTNISVAPNPPPGIMGDLLIYKVPRHTTVTFRPDDYLYSRIVNTAGAELADDTPWELTVEDPNSIVRETLVNGVYGEIKTLGDREKRQFLRFFRTIEDDFLVKLRVQTTTVTANAAATRLVLTCLREAETL